MPQSKPDFEKLNAFFDAMEEAGHDTSDAELSYLFLKADDDPEKLEELRQEFIKRRAATEDES